MYKSTSCDTHKQLCSNRSINTGNKCLWNVNHSIGFIELECFILSISPLSRIQYKDVFNVQGVNRIPAVHYLMASASFYSCNYMLWYTEQKRLILLIMLLPAFAFVIWPMNFLIERSHVLSLIIPILKHK